MSQLLKTCLMIGWMACAGGALAQDVVTPPTATVAPTTSGCTSPFCGVYAGIRGSFGMAPSQMSFAFTPGEIVNELDGATGTNEGGIFPFFLNGSTFIGAGKTYGGQYYIGAEASMGVSYTSSHQWVKDSDFGLRSWAKENFLASVSLKLGRRIERTLIYLRAGYALGRWTVNSTNTQIPDSDLLSTVYQGGVLLGLGLEYAITDKILCGVEASYTFFNSRKFTVPELGELKLRPQTIMLGASLTRQF